jgi:hypothetical protein
MFLCPRHPREILQLTSNLADDKDLFCKSCVQEKWKTPGSYSLNSQFPSIIKILSKYSNLDVTISSEEFDTYE